MTDTGIQRTSAATTKTPHPPTPRQPDEPVFDRRRSWTVLGLIVVFMLINFADKAVLGFAAIPLMDELNMSESTYGLVASAFYLLFNLTGLLVGLISTRMSSRMILFSLAVGWALAPIPVLLVAAVPTLVVSRMLLGAAEGPASPMSMHALYKWFPEGKRALPTALQIAGGSIGLLLAAPVLAFIITNYGLRAAFIALSVVAMVWSVLWLRFGQDGPFTADPAASADGDPTRPRLPYRTLLGNGTVLGGLACSFGAYWSMAIAVAWVPAYLESQVDMTPGGAASVISGKAALSLVLVLTVVPLTGVMIRRGVSSRWMRGVVQGTAVTVAGICMLAFPFVDSTPLCIALAVIAFGAPTLAYPLGYLTMAEIMPAHQRGAIFGITLAVSTLPGVIAPFLTGKIIGWSDSVHAGYQNAFLTAAVVMVIGGLVAIVTVDPPRDAHRLAASSPK